MLEEAKEDPVEDAEEDTVEEVEEDTLHRWLVRDPQTMTRFTMKDTAFRRLVMEAVVEVAEGDTMRLCRALGPPGMPMHTCMHAYTYIHTYIHTCMHACMHAYIHKHIRARARTHTHMHTS